MKNKWGCVWICCLNLFFGAVSAQTESQIRLKITDPEGIPIQLDSSAFYTSFGTLISTRFDAGSMCYILNQPLRKAKLFKTGFKPLDTLFKHDISQGQLVEISLEPIWMLLDEVVISVNKHAGKIKESTVGISILKPYLIENKINNELSQSLDQMPGVSVSDGQINIRSGSGWSYGAGSRVSLTLDELPMLSPDAGSVPFSYLPTENIESVEIIKSAGSVLFGSSALNGIVNIRTQKPTSKRKFKANLFTGFYQNHNDVTQPFSTSTQGLVGFNGVFAHQPKLTGYVVSWNVLNDQGYRMSEFNKRARISTQINHQNKHVLGLQYGVNSQIQYGKSGSFLLWESLSQGYTSLDSGKSNNQATRFNIDPWILYQHNQTNHKLNLRYLGIDNQIDNGNPNNNQNNGSSMLYAEYKMNVKPSQTPWTHTFGAVGMWSETHSPLYGGKQTATNFSGYMQTEYKHKQWIASLGGRLEYYRLNLYHTIKPVFRSGVNYALNKFSFLRASLGQGFRYPSMAEAYTQTNVSMIGVFSNPGVRPESGYNMELGYKQGYDIKGFKGFFDVSLFYTRLQNMMEYSFAQWDKNLPFYGPGFKSINVSDGSITGIEWETVGEKKGRNSTFRWLLGYTYTLPQVLNPNWVFAHDSTGNALTYNNTRFDTTNTLLKYRYQHLFRADLQWGVKHWECGLSLRYQSKMTNMDASFTRFPIGVLVPGIQTGFETLTSAWIVDIRAAFIPNKVWKINLQISNLFNTIYMSRPADLRPPRMVQIQWIYQPF